jgi:alkylation response protein AidB-like acyl-CoA dehydrogenase
VANNCLQVFGGYGFIDEYPMGKYLRDARVLTLYEGTSQIQKTDYRQIPHGHRRDVAAPPPLGRQASR